jgi:hypothetical protein
MVDDEEKIIINGQTHIFLYNLVLPLINSENKEDNNELIKIIYRFLLSTNNLR